MRTGNMPNLANLVQGKEIQLFGHKCNFVKYQIEEENDGLFAYPILIYSQGKKIVELKVGKILTEPLKGKIAATIRKISEGDKNFDKYKEILEYKNEP